MIPTEHASHQEVLRLLSRQDLAGAAAACRALNAAHPAYAPGWVTAGTLALRLGNAREALERLDRAQALAGLDAQILLHRACCLHALRRIPEAIAAADAARHRAADDPRMWDAIGGFYSRAGDQARALAAYEEAVALAPSQPGYLYNRATVRRYLGQLAEAEADFDRVIALNPADYEAYTTRSDLRPQTPQHNHIAALEALLSAGIRDWRGEVQISHALAKECEDLGLYEKSFALLERGASLRRRHLRYDVGVDVATVDWIMEAFPSSAEPALDGVDSDAPIFLLGLPRSGTTLVERILGSHSQVESAGELTCLARAIVDAACRTAGCAQLPRRELVAWSSRIDFAALGRDYLERAAASRTGLKPRFTDKMPLNYLYCGIIHRALPGAKIIHLARKPMAACYAIYKTLFKDGYPFSYDLHELARYYGAYRRLMSHWRATLPGVILDLSYEQLVAAQIPQTRRVLEHCHLAWDEACVEFHRNPSATTTASAAQVRRPMYDSSIAQWRHYERQLEPLRRALLAEGIDAAELDS